MRLYEMTLIAKTDLQTEVTNALRERIETTIKQFDGKLIRMEDKGKQRFAYEVKKLLKGHYYNLTFYAKSGVVNALEQYLRISDSVLRFQTIMVDKDPNLAEVETKLSSVKLSTAKETSFSQPYQNAEPYDNSAE